MKYLKKYNENSYILDKLDILANKLEDEIITNFPFISDRMSYINEVHKIDSNVYAIYLGFFCRGSFNNLWNDIKYDVAQIISYLKIKYNFYLMRLVTYRNMDKVTINLNTYDKDITKEERDGMFSFEIQIFIKTDQGSLLL